MDSNGIVVIAYLEMNGDIMLHMRNAMWIHCLICWYCKWLLFAGFANVVALIAGIAIG